MRPEERDAAYLWDMLQAAKGVEGQIPSSKSSHFHIKRSIIF